MKKKRLWLSMLLAATVLSFSVPAPVKAETKAWVFEASFPTSSYKHVITASKKDDEPNWYLTINKTNNGVANTLSTTNRFGCIVKKGTTTASTSHNFGKYVTSYKLGYTLDVAPKNSIELWGRKEPSSTTSGILKVSGRFTP